MKNDRVSELDRLLEELKRSGVEHGARNRTVAEKTGYSPKTVTNILSGNAPLTDRFIKVVSSAFGLNEGYIHDEYFQEYLQMEQDLEKKNRLVNAPEDFRIIALKLLDVWENLSDEKRIVAGGIMLKRVRSLENAVSNEMA